MNGLIRRDPLDDLFRGFFVRPVELGSPAIMHALTATVLSRNRKAAIWCMPRFPA